MEKSKEEVLNKLAELKRELARKQKKLEKSRRAANIRAHVRQKVIELNEKDKVPQYSLQKEPLNKNKLLTDPNDYDPSKNIGKKRVDSLSVSSYSGCWQPIKSMTENSEIITSLSQEHNFELKSLNCNFQHINNRKKKDIKLINEFKNKCNRTDDLISAHISQEETNAENNFLENKLLLINKESHKYQKTLTNLTDLNCAQQENKEYSDVINTSTEFLSASRNCKDTSDLTKMTYNLNMLTTISSMKKKCKKFDKSYLKNKSSFLNLKLSANNLKLKKLKRNSLRVPQTLANNISFNPDENANGVIYVNELLETASSRASREEIIVDSQHSEKKCFFPMTHEAEHLLNCSQELAITQNHKCVSEMLQKSVNETNTVSDTQFLTILDVTSDPKDSLEFLNTNTVCQSTLPHTNSLKNIQSSSYVSTNVTHCSNKLCDLDFTELDVIPYTKFELGEDFLSEATLSTKSNIQMLSAKKHKRHSLKVGALIKRRSPRISEHKHSPLNLIQNNEKINSVESKRKITQEHVVAIMSAFQFLKEAASKSRLASEFELPELFDDLKKKRNFQPQYYQSSSRNGEFTFFQNLLSTIKEIPNYTNSENSIKDLKYTDNQDILNSQTSKIQQKSLHKLCFINETVSDKADIIRSLPSPIAHETIGENCMIPEAQVKDSCLQRIIENKCVGIQEFATLKILTPLLNTSTPKAVKSKLITFNMTSDLDKSDILFEEDEQQKSLQKAESYKLAIELGENDSSRTSKCYLESDLNSTNFQYLNPITNNISNTKETSMKLSISYGQTIINTSDRCFDSYCQGTSPMRFIHPWKKLKRTLMTPLQVMEDKTNENQHSLMVFLPARRLSRSNNVEPKNLKYCGCFQSCSQDAVIKILCGSLMTKHEEIKNYLVSVQATSLAVWAKDDDLRWVTELDWRLPSATHLIEAELFPTTDKITIIACGWDGGFLFVSLFIYDSNSEDTKRFNIETSELLNGISSPSNALLTVVSAAEILVGITTDVHHIVGKINFFDDYTNKKICHFHKQRGHLLDIVSVKSQISACISLTSDQIITIWNTNKGILIKTLTLPVNIPCVTKLLNARSSQGTVVLETMWRTDRGCGGVIVVNPLTGTIKLLKTYPIPNSTWKCLLSAQAQMGFISAINDRGSFCIWNCHDGSLVCYSKSHRATALCIMNFDHSLFVGEIQGCLHLYKLNSETV